jgi:cytoskeletal protein RodZ
LPNAFLAQLTNALAQSLFWVYALMFFLMLLSFFVMFWFPRDQSSTQKGQQVENTEEGLQPTSTEASTHETTASS